MPNSDLRRPIAGFRALLSQIDNAVDPVAREAVGLAVIGRRSHPQPRDNANGIRAVAQHLPYNAGTLAASGSTTRGPVR